MMKRCLLLLALVPVFAAASEPQPVPLCTFKVMVRVTDQASPGWKEYEWFNPWAPAPASSRFQAQGDANWIMTNGFTRWFYPASGAGEYKPLRSWTFPPSQILRFEIIPKGLGGDDTLCMFQ